MSITLAYIFALLAGILVGSLCTKLARVNNQLQASRQRCAELELSFNREICSRDLKAAQLLKDVTTLQELVEQLQEQIKTVSREVELATQQMIDERQTSDSLRAELTAINQARKLAMDYEIFVPEK